MSSERQSGPGTVVITSCSSGFGRAAARRFAEAGWNVAATMRDPARWLEADRREGLATFALDVEEPVSVRTAIDQVIARFGCVDCVVNNAGAGLFSAFEATTMEAIRGQSELNVFGMMNVLQAVIPHMRQRGGGHVVNIASGSGIMPEPLMAAYGASKFVVEGFTEALRHEVAGHGIHVKLIEPGLMSGAHFM